MADFSLPDSAVLAKPVKPEAAIAFWQSRAAMTREEAVALDEGARRRAFFVTGLAEQGMIQDVHEALGAALENGETLRDFKARIAGVIAEKGWQGDRIDTIFRNNMQTAYMAGRWAKAQASRKSRPYGQYLTVGDDHVRPSHAILHKKVFPLDHPFWSSNTPPNGHKCRCYFITLSERQVTGRKLTVEKDMPGDGMWTDPDTGMEYHVARPGADAGWGTNPGKSWVADLAGYAAQRLGHCKPEIASVMVRRYVNGGLDAWAQHPEGDFPLVTMPSADATLVGKMSPQTWAKQLQHSPGLTSGDYSLAQEVVEKGRKSSEGASDAYALKQADGVLVVKTARQGDSLYVTDFQRLGLEDAKRSGYLNG